MKKQLYQIIALFIIEIMLLLPVSFAFNLFNVQVTQITSNSAKISWKTDEYATGIVHYGETKDLGYKQRHTNYLFEHSLYLYGLDDETEYYVAIESTDINGTTKIDNNSNKFYTFKTSDITPPAKVIGLVAEDKGDDYAYIKWGSVNTTDLSHYNIYRDRIKIANATQTSFNDSGLMPDRSYSYKISAVDTSGNEGSLSDTYIATTLKADKTPPKIVKVEVDKITDTTATIKWITDENSTSIIYYGLNQTLDKIKEDKNFAVNHTLQISSLVKGNKYSYRASSCDIRNNCANFTIMELEAGADRTPPMINTTIPEFYNKRTIDLIGNVEPYSRVMLYVNDMLLAVRALDREKTSDGTFEFYNVILSKSNVIKLWAQDKAGNVNQQSYSLVVDTQDPVVNLEDIPSTLNQKNLTIKGNVNEFVIMNVFLKSGEETEPAKISGLKAKVKNSSVELSWNKSTEKDFSHYVVYRSDVGAIAITKPASYNTYEDVLVNNGQSYTYQITAVNEFGKEGPKSDPATVLISEGGKGLPKPQEIVEVVRGTKKPTLSVNLSGSFSKSIRLQKDGIYALKIEFIDRAKNTVLIEKEITLDTKPPEIKITRPTRGTFIYENYANEVDIEGKTEPGAEVHLYIERTPLGFLNKSFDVSGLPNEIQHLSESKLRVDCRLGIAGTSFCSTGADYSTIADDDGNFKFEEVDLTSFFGIGTRITEVPSTEFSRERELKDSTETRLVFVATDKSGLRNAKGITYRIGTCWAGNFSWELTPLLQYQSPSLLSMERLRENNEYIYFYFNYTYVGRGRDGKIVGKDGVSIRKACDGTDLLKDPRFNLSCEMLSPSGQTRVNPEGSISYSVIKLERVENMDQWLEDDWKSFFNSVSNEMTFPFKIIIRYKHEVDGKTVEEVQTTCQEVTYVLDNSLVDFRNVLPDWVLYDFVDFLNESITTINKIQLELKKVIDYVSVGCVASFLLRLGWQMYRRWVSIFDEKMFLLKEGLGIDSLKFKSEKEEDEDYCKDVAKAIIAKKGFNLGDFRNIKLKYFSDADLKKCFPATAAAWETEAKLYKLYRYSCDRIFGHSTPSRWTEEASDGQLYTKLKTGTGCAVDESVRGQPMRVVKCRDVAKDFGYAQDHFNMDDKCFIFREGKDETLYTLSDLEDREHQIYTIKHQKGPGRASSDYAIKQNENNFITAQNKNCEEVCGISSGKKEEPSAKDQKWDKGKPKNEPTKESKGYWDCIPASECRALRGQPGTEERPEVKEVSTQGFTKDCFYKSDAGWAPKELGNSGSVSNDPVRRYECCCINAVEYKDEGYYRYDDRVRYTVVDSNGVAYDTQPAYAFESKKKPGEPPEDVENPQSTEAWADMEWSYRYWKEKYEAVSKKIVTEKKGISHYEYNPNRYIEDRDHPACFGQNSWLYDGAGFFGVETKPGEGNLLVIDPAKQHISAFQCLHISGIYNRLQLLKNMMSALSSCLITVRTTGKGDSGVCKEIFTQYVCSLVWYVIQFWQEGCLPFGYGIDIGGSENKMVQYVSAGIKSMWGSVADSRTELMEEYGNAKLNNLLGAGEEQIARKICLAAFGYDWELNLESVIDAAYASPSATLVQKMTGTREFLTVDPDTSKARYEYRASWLINPGCDLRSYKVELSCVSRNEMQEYGTVAGGMGFNGINCEKVQDPAGHNCDCLELDKEKTKTFLSPGYKLGQGALEDKDHHDIMPSDYRYDHLKFTLYPDTRINSELGEKCFPDGHYRNGAGVFYFPIRDKTIKDIVACHADWSQGQFICRPGVDFWTQKGRAQFMGVNVIIDGKKYKKDDELTAFKGSTLEIEPIIRKLTGPPICLVFQVARGSSKGREQTITIDMEGEYNYPIVIDKNMQVTGSGGISDRATDCEPGGSEQCKEITRNSLVKLKAISTTNTKKEEITLEFIDEWSLSGNPNGKIDLSKNSQDVMIVDGRRKTIGQWWSEEYREVGVVIELENKGIILKVDDIGYAKGIEWVKYNVEVNPVGQSDQYWNIDLKLYQTRDNSTDCGRYKEEIVEFAGRDQRENIRIKVKGQETEDPYKPQISIDAKGDVIPIEENLPYIIEVTVTDDKGVDEVKYEIKKPDDSSLKDNENKGIKRMNCDDSSTSNYERQICEIKLDAEDLNMAGEYKIIIKAKDKDPEKKQTTHSENREETFDVRCYSGYEYGACQKKGECGYDRVMPSPEIDCVDRYECCKIGQIKEE